MYQLLLVDDEPIVISGIKFLIDWKNSDLTVIGTARSGQQALELIDEGHPDIVICDINMPGMTGLELLKKVSERTFSPVFIMLTNHSEFDMARESLRYNAIDYLLKSQLEPEVLAQALEKAKQAVERRRKIANIDLIDNVAGEQKSRVVGSTLRKLLENREPKEEASRYECLRKSDVLRNYLFLQVMLDYSALPDIGLYTEEDLRKIYESVHEVFTTLLPKAFRDYALFYPDEKHNSFVVFCWDLPFADCRQTLDTLYAKLITSSRNLTPTRLSMLVTQQYSGEKALPQAIAQLRMLQQCYYPGETDFLCRENAVLPQTRPLEARQFINRLMLELRSKNIAQCKVLLQKISAVFEETPHTRDDAVRVCCELYSLASTVLIPLLEKETTNDYFTNVSRTINRLNTFIHFRQIRLWLSEFSTQVINLLEQLTNSKYELGEKVKRYVHENVDKRIMLQDVADTVSISPSYLSALFKKEYGQNLVDYINAQKMERASELIREGRYRIYEISYMLSFENAYYFTKVFKRHMGMTPKEYQYKVRGIEEKNE